MGVEDSRAKPRRDQSPLTTFRTDIILHLFAPSPSPSPSSIFHPPILHPLSVLAFNFSNNPLYPKVVDSCSPLSNPQIPGSMDKPTSIKPLSDFSEYEEIRSRRSPRNSQLEGEVLDEYQRLANNMQRLSDTLYLLITPRTNGVAQPVPPPITTSTPTYSRPTPPLLIEIAEALRVLERKVAPIYTLLKTSVYSIVLQQGEMDHGSEVPRMGVMGGANGEEEEDEESE